MIVNYDGVPIATGNGAPDEIITAVCCKPDVRDGGIGLAVLYPARG